MIEIALFQPDIAGNVGTILRLSACLGARCHIIEPCGFAFGDRALKRAGMDYLSAAHFQRHADWSSFASLAAGDGRRVLLMTTSGSTALHKVQFQNDDILLMGSEGAGAPDHVHANVDGRIHIPMRSGFRSLNVAVVAGIALGEALRQTEQYPDGA